ncbi:MAG: thiamine phosphate synthase [Candidatus Omnitrophica bacterium]|nr:thiamine phosphate synthase [Candidatus Omnitrophota bacterium]
MKSFNLQVILDRGILKDKDMSGAASKIIDGGASLLQLRDKISNDRELLKEAKVLRRLTKDKGCKLIINDRVDIAIASSSDGVHLGQDDIPYSEARRLLGKEGIIGISTHTIEEARAAEKAGADYIGVGPIFATSTKPNHRPIGLEIISKIAQEIRIPVFFIGGIDLTNIEDVIRSGGKAFAVASAILKSGNITETTKSFIETICKAVAV